MCEKGEGVVSGRRAPRDRAICSSLRLRTDSRAHRARSVLQLGDGILVGSSMSRVICIHFTSHKESRSTSPLNDKPWGLRERMLRVRGNER